MANRGTVKRRSLDHENFIADQYDGTRSPSSGAALSQLSADVESVEDLFECKQRGEIGKEPKTVSVNLAILAELTNEAYRVGKEPVMALRAFSPKHPLADRDGNVDLIVRHISDDLIRFDCDCEAE